MIVSQQKYERSEASYQMSAQIVCVYCQLRMLWPTMKELFVRGVQNFNLRSNAFQIFPRNNAQPFVARNYLRPNQGRNRNQTPMEIDSSLRSRQNFQANFNESTSMDVALNSIFKT